MLRKQSSIVKNSSFILIFFLVGCGGPNKYFDLYENKEVMVRQWTRPTHGPFEAGDRGYEYSNPVLYENTLVFGNQSLGIISLYPGLNEVRWVLPIQNGVLSELAVINDMVLFGGGDGYFYSVNIETGEVNWRYELRNSFVSQPVVKDGRVFVTTSDDTIYAFDVNTGKWLWHYRRRSGNSATILGASSPLVWGSDVIVGLSDGYLVSVSVEEGKLKWEKRIHRGSKFTDVDAHPVLFKGVIYIPSYDGALYAIRLNDQKTLWRYDAGGSKRVEIEGNRLFLPSSNGGVVALRRESGEKIWEFELDSGVPTQLTVTDRYIVVGSSYQYLYLLEKSTGRPVYRYNVGYKSGFAGSMAYNASQKKLYALSSAGNLYAFRLRKPDRKIRPFGKSRPFDFLSLWR